MNQYYKSTISDEVFNIISKELGVNVNLWEILHKFYEYTNKHRKIFQDKYDSQSEDYRDINEVEKSKCVNDKLSKLPIHEKLQKQS